MNELDRTHIEEAVISILLLAYSVLGDDETEDLIEEANCQYYGKFGEMGEMVRG